MEIHKSGVIHGDLDARNVAISYDGDISVLDFGQSECGHVCDGEHCDELLELCQALGIGFPGSVDESTDTPGETVSHPGWRMNNMMTLKYLPTPDPGTFALIYATIHKVLNWFVNLIYQ